MANTIDYEKLSKCLEKNLNRYAWEKAHSMLIRDYYPKLDPEGFILYLSTARMSITEGIDYDGKKITRSPIFITSSEAVNLAECLHDDKYASQVKKILDENKIYSL